MKETLLVWWLGVVYEVIVCLTTEQAKAASAEWSDGIVDLARLFEPGRVTAFSVVQRHELATFVLERLGYPTASPLQLLKGHPSPAAREEGAFPAARGAAGARAAAGPGLLLTQERLAEIAQLTVPTAPPSRGVRVMS